MGKMSRLKISVYLVAIFLAGAVTGALVTFKIGKQMFGHPPRPEQMAGHWCGELETKLGLTPAQKQTVLGILTDEMGNFQTVVGCQMLMSLTNSNARISAVLTPEQRLKFVEIEKQQREFIRRFDNKKDSTNFSFAQTNTINPQSITNQQSNP